MLSVDGNIEVRCSREHAWDLFTRFQDVARLIPSVEEVEIHGERVLAKVCVKLGVLPVTSRVVIEVTERTELSCIRASGVSYLGETIVEQIATKALREIDADSVGKLDLHLDIRPTEASDRILIVYVAGVEAEGRLKKIYQSILKTKAPAMMAEFAVNIRNALESTADDAHRAVSLPEGSGPTEEGRDFAAARSVPADSGTKATHAAAPADAAERDGRAAAAATGSEGAAGSPEPAPAPAMDSVLPPRESTGGSGEGTGERSPTSQEAVRSDGAPRPIWRRFFAWLRSLLGG